jgi:hypothetical protein
METTPAKISFFAPFSYRSGRKSFEKSDRSDGFFHPSGSFITFTIFMFFGCLILVFWFVMIVKIPFGISLFDR